MYKNSLKVQLPLAESNFQQTMLPDNSNSEQGSSILEPYADKYAPTEASQHSLIDPEEQPVHESELMRTVTQYTNYSLNVGQEVFDQEGDEENKLPGQPLKYRFFSKHNKKMRISALKQYTIIVVILMTFIIGVWSIYWGSMYNRQHKYVNLKLLIAVETNSSAPISQALIDTTTDPRLAKSAGWVIRSGLNPDDIVDMVHDQHYWAAIYVTDDNASQLINQGFQTGSNVNTTGLVRTYYETGRDMSTMQATLVPTLLRFGDVFQYYLQTSAYPQFIEPLTSDQFSALRGTNLLNFPDILYTDGAPVTNPVVLGPLQVGLIYIIIVTFFQFMWFIKLNTIIGKATDAKDYIIYRMLASQVTFLFLSLAFTCLNAAFQIPMNNSWSGGFGVMWMISYLTMSAVGGANENIALIAFATLPPFFGFWLLFFVMINISGTFSPLELCPGFYKFTFAMPIKNGYELMKVLIFNTTRKHIGRQFGILIAWIVLNNLLLPFCLIFFAERMKKQAMAEHKAKLVAANKNENEKGNEKGNNGA